MKKTVFILFLITPLVLFSQPEVANKLANIFSYKNDELRELINSKPYLLKISKEEIDSIYKIISDRRNLFFELRDKVRASIPADESGKPLGKANPEFIAKINAVQREVSTLINALLGDKRYRQFHRMLIDEAERKNMERLMNAGKIKPRKK